MPGSLSDYLEQNIINATLRGVALPLPTNVFLALFTASPTDANITANEVTLAAWPAYVRQNAAAGGPIANGWSAPVNGVSNNALLLTFPANNGAAAVTVTHIGLYDAATGGNLLYHNVLAISKTMQPTDVLTFPANTISITLD
jgi:hypothetical protein